MGSTRVSIGLCLVMLVGVVATLPAAVSAQQDQVTVTATIVDQDGDAVGSGVDVMASWDGGSVNGTTASNGQVLLDVPRGANVSIQIDDDRYVRNIPYTVTDASTESVDVPVAESGTATITVQNAANETVEDARVLLYRSGQYITDQRTDADGTVTTPAIEDGSYRLEIYKSGYYNNRSRITVDGQTEVTQTIEQGEVPLTVSVEDDYSDPPETLDASVQIPGVGTLQTGDDGDATITVSVNTNYDITVTKDGYDQAQQSVRVGEQATTATVSLDRTDQLTISARSQVLVGNPITLEVTDEYDDPVADATVTRGGEQVGTTDESGELDIETESTGTLTFTVDDGDVQETVTVNVVPAGQLTTPTAASTPTPTATPTETSTPTEAGTSTADGPGFTPVTAVAALALLSLVAYRRR